MDEMSKILEDTKRLMLVRYPRFGSEIAAANISYRDDLKYHTAATDGKNIYFDPNYLASLSETERVFVIAHEIMHIKFAHALRIEDKNGVRRNPEIWNEATDAIINANLERDGFTIKEGYVNRPEALKYSAEEFYNILLEEKKSKESEDSKENKSNEQDNNPSKDMNDSEKKHIGDDHSLWEEAFKKVKQGDYNSADNNDKVENKKIPNYDESEEFSSNRKERISKAKENLNKMKNELLSGNGFSQENNLGPVGRSIEEFDWKLLLRREIKKTETIWSQRRSLAENNYAYRLEEYDIEDEADTEVMIDVSGSVDLDLVKAFLRMLKPILKCSKLRVGCFNMLYWGMTEIRSENDIDNFEIPDDARGIPAITEDWDLAVRSFSKKKEINKIVFTDGYPCPGTMPKDDLKKENVIWLVYGNKDFKPCCGTVIQISEKQLEEMHDFNSLEDDSGKFR